MEKGLVSITVIAYNAENTLRGTLNSISAQQHVKMQVVLVDDKSNDKTLEIMEEFKDSYPSILCTILKNESNMGITKSRNLALSLCKGEYIAVLDSDDFWISPLKLRTQLEFMESNPDCRIVGTQANIVDMAHKVIKTTSYSCDDTEIREKMLILNQFCHSSILMKHTQDIKYDDSFYIWEDYEMILKTGMTGKLANLPDVMVSYLYKKRKLPLKKRFLLTHAEIEIIKKYKKEYPNYTIGYLKGIVKYVLNLLNLK